MKHEIINTQTTKLQRKHDRSSWVDVVTKKLIELELYEWINPFIDGDELPFRFIFGLTSKEIYLQWNEN